MVEQLGESQLMMAHFAKPDPHNFHQEYETDNGDGAAYYTTFTRYDRELDAYDSTASGTIIASHDYLKAGQDFNPSHSTVVQIGYSHHEADYVAVTQKDVAGMRNYYEAVKEGKTAVKPPETPILIFSGPFVASTEELESPNTVRREGENLVIEIVSFDKQTERIVAPFAWEENLTNLLMQEGKNSEALDSEHAFIFTRDALSSREIAADFIVPQQYPVIFTPSDQ